jgi:uracil-DNA glycosylase family 4
MRVVSAVDKWLKLRGEIIACKACHRLVLYREQISREKRAAFRDEQYWGKPLPGFGDLNSELLIVGLAPAAHGGNRTGRVFTGDSSASFLMSGLHAYGFANQSTSLNRADGLTLNNAFILAIVRCAPPDNKPLPGEILNCRSFLIREAQSLSNVKAVLALGKIAMDGYLKAFHEGELLAPKPVFKHGAQYQLDGKRLFVSYHPSRQNTQTGRLTAKMFGDVIANIRAYLAHNPSANHSPF